MQGCGQGKLQTERLFLRELDAGDIDFVASMLEDPGVTRFYPKRYTRADAVGWIERQQARYAKDGYGLWLVLLRVELIPVGQVGLLRQEVNGIPTPEIGYLLAQRYPSRQPSLTGCRQTSRDASRGVHPARRRRAPRLRRRSLNLLPSIQLSGDGNR
jgi:hypothetical protein